MTALSCPWCHNPSVDGLPCGTCTELLRTTLEDDVLFLIEQLTVSASRQTRTGVDTETRAKSTTRPLPVDLGAADMLALLCATMSHWALRLGGDGIEPALMASRTRLHHLRGHVAQLEAARPEPGGTTPKYRRAVAVHHAAVAEALGKVAETERLVARLGHELLMLHDGGPGSVRWMLRHLKRIRRHPEFSAMMSSVLNLAVAPSADVNASPWSARGGRAWAVVDLPTELIPLGECGAELPPLEAGELQPCACSHHRTGGACDVPGGCASVGCVDGWRQVAPLAPATCTRKLAVPPGTPTIDCPACGARHDVRTRRNIVLDDAAHFQGRPPHLSQIFQVVGIHCTPAMIRGHALRGRITATATDEATGATWYRLGDVHELLLGKASSDAVPASPTMVGEAGPELELAPGPRPSE